MRNIMIFVAIALICQFTYADKKLTIKNAETGDSISVTVPDDLVFTQSHSYEDLPIEFILLDARYGDVSAYEALGNLCRYGRNGMEKSYFKMGAYYGFAQNDSLVNHTEAEDDVTKICANTIAKLVDVARGNDWEPATNYLDSLNKFGYNEADVLRFFMGENKPDNLQEIVDEYVINPKQSTDKALFVFLGCVSRRWLPDAYVDMDALAELVAKKYPLIYNKLGIKALDKIETTDDMEVRKELENKVFYFLTQADNSAFLDGNFAKSFLRYFNQERKNGRLIEVEETLLDRVSAIAISTAG